MSAKTYNAQDTEKTTAKKKNRDMQYMDEHQKRVPLNFKLEDYEKLKAAADAVPLFDNDGNPILDNDGKQKRGIPVGTYIKQAIRERMEREATPPPAPTVEAEQKRQHPYLIDNTHEIPTAIKHDEK